MQYNIDSLIREIKNIYKIYGYSQYKMNKFEEYDTYVKNKDFLISDKIITFTDMNGKLLAMKPDVTISIIKNAVDVKGFVQKVFYNENVYRVSNGSHSFKEIMQCGLECIGDVDLYNICETIMLASKSLGVISESYVLDISHMGLVASLIKSSDIDDDMTKKILNAVSEKNIPEIISVCEQCGANADYTNRLIDLVLINGSLEEVYDRLDAFCIDEKSREAVCEIKEIADVLKATGMQDNICIDFSVVNDMSYYNGIVMRGYIDGIPSGVLSGGQYDRLMQKMGKGSKAIGFAIYLDALERMFTDESDYDADVLLCYDDSVSARELAISVKKVVDSGKSVITQHSCDTNARCREVINIGGGEGK